MKTLYIRFRNDDGSFDIYKSPSFDFLIDEEDFDNFVCDGVDNFYINCDREGGGDNIIFLMFNSYDKIWIDELLTVWNVEFKDSPLPDFNKWVKIDTLDEAYR